MEKKKNQDTKLENLPQQRQQEENVTRELSESNSRGNAELTAVQTELLPLRTHLAATSPDSEVIRDLRIQELQSLRTQLEALRTQPAESKSEISQLTEEGTRLGQQLKEAHAKLKSMQEPAAVQGQASANQTEAVSSRAVRLESELQSLLTETQARAVYLNVDLQAHLKSFLRGIQDAVARSQADCLDLAHQLQKAIENYERELAQYVKQLNSALEGINSYLVGQEDSISVTDAGAVASSAQATGATNARIQELEVQNRALTAAGETLLGGSHNALTEEKETMAAQLNEAQKKIASLEQSREEANASHAALQSQLKARIAPMERENADLTNMRQASEAELKSSNQRVTQEQLELLNQQQQQIQQTAVTTRTVAVQPTSVAVSPMVPPPPLIATTAPSRITASPIRHEEMSPASSSAPAVDGTVAGPSSEQPRNPKRSNETGLLSSAVKRTRLLRVEEERAPVVLHEGHGPVSELHNVDAPAVVEVEQDQKETEPLPPSAPEVIEEESTETEAFTPNVPPTGASQEVFGGLNDGIVPSTPVLLRPRNINEGFAEAVSSSQVTTAGTHFVFGAVPELLVVPPGAGSGGIGHLESHGGMEETRMDLSHLEEGSSRIMPSTPHQVSPLEEMPVSVASEEPSGVAHQPTAEQQADFEGGPDREGDAAAEMDLFGADHHGAERR